MKLSRKVYFNQEKVISRIEMVCFEDVTEALALSNDLAPENSAPNIPLKLHAFMVMASYETLWDKVMVSSEKFNEHKDYN